MEPRKSTYVAVRSALSGLLAMALLASIMGGCDTAATGYPSAGGQTNGGPAQSTPNTAPALTFTKPDSNATVYVGQIQPITWFASDREDSILVKLYYDKDALQGTNDEFLLTQVQKSANDYSASSFSWNTSSLAPGTYHILAVVDDGQNGPVTVYNNNTVTVRSSIPALTMTEPFGPMSVQPAQNLVIKWTQFAPLGASTVTLFYDTDRNYANGTTATIATISEPTDTYVWNVPAVRAGTYYLGAALSDGTHPVVVSYASGSVGITGPQIVMSNPLVDVQWHGGGALQFLYAVTTSRNVGTVKLFYDNDGVGFSGDEKYLIMFPLAAGATNWTWKSGSLPIGTYHVGAEMNDNLNDPTVDYAEGLVQELGPTVKVSAPTGVTQWYSGGTVNVTYQAYATNATAEIFYDVDGLSNTNDEVMAGSYPVQNGVTTTHALTVPVLSNGTYHVGVKLSDGTTTAWGYAPGTIVVIGPTLQITSPAGPVPTTVGAGDVLPVTIQYRCDGQPSSVHIFYDTNTTYDGVADEAAGRRLATKAEVATSGAAASDTVNCTIPLLLQNTYHIGASLWVGGVLKATAYSGADLVVNGPMLVLTNPATDVRVQPGAMVTIRWSNQLPGLTPKITLWYDVDQTYTPADDDPNQIIANLPVDPTLVGSSYDWPVPLNLTNPPLPAIGYYIGATVTDDLGQKTTAYSAGRVTIVDRTFFSYLLGDVESKRLGRTFRGLAPNGDLGGVIAHVPWTRQKVDPKDASGQTLMRQPGISTNKLTTGVDVDPVGTSPARTYDDFVLVAPHATPFYLTRPSAGEAYLILSDPAILFTVPAVGTFSPIYVTATGTALLPGAIFAGPASTSTSNNGIGDVAISRPAKSDTNPDILFGIPLVTRIVQEEQDYDPWDYWVYDYLLSLNVPGFSPNNFSVSYGDSYRPPLTTTGPSLTYVDGTEAARNGAWNSITAGMVIAVSSTTVNNPNPITTPTGRVPGQQILFALDNVGQAAPEPHPRVVSNSYSPYTTAPVPVANLLGPKGLRYYAPWWLTLYGNPQYHQFQKLSIPAASPNDLSQFGQGVIEADLDGDGKPEWLGLQPYDPTSGVVTTGLIHIQWTDKSQLWDTPLDALSLQGDGLVQFRPVTRAITDTVTDTGTTTTTTDTVGAVTTVTAPISPDLTFCQRVYSWPYAVANNSFIADLVTITTTTNTNLTGPPAVTKTKTSITYGYENKIDTRGRKYCWPMVSDTLKGEAGAVLTGLANAGDFNADNHEDFTVGSPSLGGGAGASYLVFGQSQYGDLSLGNIGATAPILPGLKIVGAAGSLCGTSQAAAGDVNGNGVADWIIGAPSYGGGLGAVGVVFGNQYVQGIYQFSDIGTAKLPGLIFTGETAGDNAGMYVAGVGDVDGDGCDDIVIVAPFATRTVNGKSLTGVAYLIYGSLTLYNELDSTKNVISLAKVGTAVLPGMMYIGSEDQTVGVMGLGPVAPAGDVNDDGFADFLIGNPNFDVRDPAGTVIVPKTGEVYLIRGGPRLTP